MSTTEHVILRFYSFYPSRSSNLEIYVSSLLVGLTVNIGLILLSTSSLVASSLQLLLLLANIYWTNCKLTVRVQLVHILDKSLVSILPLYSIEKMEWFEHLIQKEVKQHGSLV
jgi:hypothetical protein